MAGSVLIQVECYSGSRVDESPRSFLVSGRRHEVAQIVDRWYQASRDPAVPASDYYKVRTVEGLLYIIRLDRESSAWYLVTAGSPW